MLLPDALVTSCQAYKVFDVDNSDTLLLDSILKQTMPSSMAGRVSTNQDENEVEIEAPLLYTLCQRLCASCAIFHNKPKK